MLRIAPTEFETSRIEKEKLEAVWGMQNVRQEAFKIIAYVYLKSKAMSIQSHKTHRGVDD